MKIERLSKKGKVICIRGCEWNQQNKNLNIESPFSRFFLQNNITKDAILNAVYNDSWFGLLQVDIYTPERRGLILAIYQRKNFIILNIVSIFKKCR